MQVGIAPPPANRSRTLPAALIVLAVVVTAGLFGWRLWPACAAIFFDVCKPDYEYGDPERIALSGDGKFLAEVKNDAGQRTVWIRNLATNTDTQILKRLSQSVSWINLSPDANYLYFHAGNTRQRCCEPHIYDAGLWRYTAADRLRCGQRAEPVARRQSLCVPAMDAGPGRINTRKFTLQIRTAVTTNCCTFVYPQN